MEEVIKEQLVELKNELNLNRMSSLVSADFRKNMDLKKYLSWNFHFMA